MDNIAVYLSKQHWDQVLNILGTTREHPWVVTNPLLMQIGEQVRVQLPQPPQPEAGAGGLRPGNVNGPNKEVRS